MGDLDRREEAFRRLESRIFSRALGQPGKVTSLILSVPMTNLQNLTLQHAAEEYLQRSFGGMTFQILQNSPAINYSRVTPNGMVVPKRDSALEYNLLVLEFAKLIDSFGFADLIHSWHVPLNVRVKFGEVTPGNLERAHPTEYPHSDSWAGESAESVTVHIPLFGDFERNYLAMYQPPKTFEEAWLGPRTTYKEGADSCVDQYEKIQYVPKCGEVLLMDFSTLHASYREPGASARISIDTTFVLRKLSSTKEIIHPWRLGERAAHSTLLGLGSTHFLSFPDAPEDRVDSVAFQHPTRMMIKELR